MSVKDFLTGLLKMFERVKHAQSNYHFYKWLLDNGKLRNTSQFSKKELEFVKNKMKQSGIVPQPKECYYVSQLMAFAATEDFKYMEGYADSIIPTEHAWLEYKGKVLDIVWGCLEHSKTPDGCSADPDNEYFGVEVPHNLIMENVSEREIAEPLLFLMFEKSKGGEK